MPSTRRTFLGACTGALAALSGCLSLDRPTAEGSWPRRTLNNAHTGYSPTDGPRDSLHAEWHRTRSEGAVQTSPVVRNGTLYYAYSREARGDERGGTWAEAFDAATGESRWRTELWRTDEFHYFYHSDSLVLRGDRLLVQTKAGLKALDLNGTERWTFDNLHAGQQMPDVIPPIVTDDLVVTGTYDTIVDGKRQVETVFGIDANTGEERWRTEFPDHVGMWQLAAADGVVYVPMISSDEALVALDLGTGEERWRSPIPVSGTPTVADGRIFVPLREDDREFIAAVDPATRSIEWRKRIGGRWSDSGLAVAHGLVYHVNDFGVEARRVGTGERVWRFGGRVGTDGESREGTPEIGLVSTPVVAGGSVYVPGWIQRDTMYGHLFVLDALTGEERARVELGRNRDARQSVPAVTADLVFLATDAGDLYAFGECDAALGGRCVVD